jgi:hypothetical protein
MGRVAYSSSHRRKSRRGEQWPSKEDPVTQSLQFTWGDALVVKVHRTRVGLLPYVNAIQEVVGKHIGSRPTFAKLYDAAEVGELDATEKYRAWLLLTAMGESPEAWGVNDDAVPRGTSIKPLQRELARLVRHQGLEPRTRWFEFSDNVPLSQPVAA